MTPIWLNNAWAGLGQREIPGPAENSWIVALWKKIKRGGIKSESVAWCAAFVGACLEDAGFVSSRFEGASSYLTWGQEAPMMVGSIIVLERPGGYHVGFLVGWDRKAGVVYLLGGNHGDAVSVSSFPLRRVKAVRWPRGAEFNRDTIPVVVAGSTPSVSEA